MTDADTLLALAQEMADATRRQRFTRSAYRIGRDGRMRMTSEFVDAKIAMDQAERKFRKAVQQPYQRLRQDALAGSLVSVVTEIVNRQKQARQDGSDV